MDMMKSSIYEYEFKNIELLLQEVKAYTYAVIYRLDKIEIMKANEITDLCDLLEIRAFCSDRELKLINDNGRFIGRIRVDFTGEDTEYLDQIHLVWGEPASYENGKTLLTEERGTKLLMPIEIKKGQRAFIIVRNYLSAEAFEFTDFRLVDFITKEAELYEL